TIFPTHFVNRRVRFLQSPSFMLRNLRPDLFQSSLSRPYANSSPSPHTSPEETAILANIIVTGLVGLISVDLLYAWYRNGCNERLLNETVEKGTRPEIDVLNDELVSRPLVVDRLKKIFQPHRNQSFYHMVCGEHGTGKTTLTRIASREVGQGVIYVDIPADIEDFGKAFGRALNFAFEEHISWTRKVLGDTNMRFEDPKWKRAMEAFKRASAVYKKKHNKPPVIVYDNVSRLVHKNPKILDILQDDAKKNADDRKYIAVFVSSEGSVPRRMETRSAWSRAKPVVEIGDLSKEESMTYLTKKRNINEVDAKKLYELVGGRFLDLKTVADDFLAGQSSEVIKQQVLTEVEKKFQSARLLPKDPRYEVGKSIINDLLKSKELSFLEFKLHFDENDELNEVLGSNIFAYHPEKNTVSFQSQSVKYYILEKADIFIKK
ncbi:13317_t:CDS:2, partial [Acaulospora morrowiae]